MPSGFFDFNPALDVPSAEAKGVVIERNGGFYAILSEVKGSCD
jgi:hypothetical protein